MKLVLLLTILTTVLSVNAQSIEDTSVPNFPISLETKDIGIKCESKDKSLLVIGYIPKDSNEGSLTIKVNGKQFSLSQNSRISSSGVSMHVVEDILNGVLTLSVESREYSNYKYDLKLSSIPKTMTGKYGNRNFDISFSAKLHFLKDSNSSCEDGCIVMPMEATQSKAIYEHVEVDCISRY